MPQRSTYLLSRYRPRLATMKVLDFSGGWNPRAAPSELANNESPDCLNVSLDERGGVVKRLGLTNLGTGSYLSNAPSNVFYWKSGGYTIVQDGTAVKKTTDWSSFTTIKTYSTSATAAFCDFQGKLIAVHPADRVSTYDGTTWTDIGAGSPKGGAIAAWQNKVWVTADPDNQARVYASAQGNASSWTVGTDFIDIREKDGQANTALGAGQGMDISGRPGLLVFKKNYVGRINDSKSGATFGQYTTLHNAAGAASAQAVISTHIGLICFIGDRGIYVTDGVSQPTLASSNVQNLFDPSEINFGAQDKWVAGNYKERAIFSITRGSGQTTNNFVLEFHPEIGWIVPHAFGVSSMTTFGNNTSKLYGGSPTAGRVWNVFVGGSDDGTAIASRFQTRWFEPGSAYNTRLRRLRVQGRGAFNLYTRGDYTQGTGALSQFAGLSSGSIWGGTTWGGGTWGADLLETFRDFYSLGVARSVSWNLSETSSTSAVGPKLLTDGSAPEIGAFALYGLTLDFVRLGGS